MALTDSARKAANREAAKGLELRDKSEGLFKEYFPELPLQAKQ